MNSGINLKVMHVINNKQH